VPTGDAAEHDASAEAVLIEAALALAGALVELLGLEPPARSSAASTASFSRIKKNGTEAFRACLHSLKAGDGGNEKPMSRLR
jgi:hypothetical protein